MAQKKRAKSRGKGKGWREKKKPVLTKKGIKKKARRHQIAATKRQLSSTLRQPLKKANEPEPAPAQLQTESAFKKGLSIVASMAKVAAKAAAKKALEVAKAKIKEEAERRKKEQQDEAERNEKAKKEEEAADKINKQIDKWAAEKKDREFKVTTKSDVAKAAPENAKKKPITFTGRGEVML